MEEQNKYNQMNYTQDVIERFWDKVNVPDDWEEKDQCWEWNAGSWNGYGQFLLHKNKKISAHKFIYQYYNGIIPNGLIIRHKCDNTLCCNPNHLEFGTQFDNIHDMINRGRQNKAKGSKNGNSILTEDTVVEILESVKNGDYQTQLQIAIDYSVSKSIISNIFNGRFWTTITNNYDLIELKKNFSHPNSSLTNEEVSEIRKLILDEKTNLEISSIYNVSEMTISRIRNNKIYQNF